MTLHLPKELVERLYAAAMERQIASGSVVAEILADSLPVLRKSADAEFEQRIQEIFSLTEEQLRECIHTEMTPEYRKRGRKLLALNKQRSLTDAERSELNAVHQKGDDVALTRAAAIWLLQSQHKPTELSK